MDMSELALKMLEWERLMRQAGDLAAEIEQAVLGLGKTQTVGNVRATYSQGRRSFDYKAAARDAPAELLDKHTKTVVQIDWKAICGDAEIKLIPFTQGSPSVRLKLLEE